MLEREEIIFCGQEVREVCQEAIEVGGIEEAQRRGINVQEIRHLHPNEIVIEKVEPSRAKEWFDALCVVCLPLWIDQLRALGVHDSGYYQMVKKERDERRRTK